MEAAHQKYLSRPCICWERLQRTSVLWRECRHLRRQLQLGHTFTHHPPMSQRGSGWEAGTANRGLGAESMVWGWDSTCYFCFRVSFGDTECSFSNVHVGGKMCVWECVCVSQNGYYDLMNIKFTEELIIYGYICVSEYTCVHVCVYVCVCIY